jgi:hypothetical protein
MPDLSPYIQPLITQILIPEIAALFRFAASRNQPAPTDAEVLAALNLDADRVLALGQAFLSQTKP